MAARYYVLVSQELLDWFVPWENAGLRMLVWGEFTEPGVRWCLIEDDNAPPELNNKRVELTLTATDDGITVDREVIS
jgi:hypothetical protein